MKIGSMKILERYVGSRLKVTLDDAAVFARYLLCAQTSAQKANALYYKMPVQLLSYNVWHICFLKMWHMNPCAFSVKEMFL